MCRSSTPLVAKCDRCDGCHLSAECPHFRRPRDEHRDAQPMPLAERPPPSTSAPAIIHRGKLIKQPGDGSCLYHSIVSGLQRLRLPRPTAANLRKQLAAWARVHPRKRIAGSTVRAWLHWEMGGRESLEDYCSRQAVGGWGGVIEIIGAAVEFGVSISVWVPEPRKAGHFRRTVSRSSTVTSP